MAAIYNTEYSHLHDAWPAADDEHLLKIHTRCLVCDLL